MERLNFPPLSVPLKIKENKRLIWDPIRKKYIQITPEEWVRQHCVQFLMSELHVPKSVINVEKQIQLNGRTKRYDIVVFSSSGAILLLIECKARSNVVTEDSHQSFNTVCYEVVSDWDVSNHRLQFKSDFRGCVSAFTCGSSRF